jgi:hypothetical protein
LAPLNAGPLKEEDAMFVDIEPEYNDFIHNAWRDLAHSTNDIRKFHQKPDHAYNIMSRRLIRFLRAKLKNLETKKK